MSADDTRPGSMDARLRRLFAGADTAPGFEARVMARIAALRALPTGELLARVEHRRERTRRRLRRDAWVNAVAAAGVGAAGIALVWRHGPAVARFVEAGLAAIADPGVIAGMTFCALAAGLWPLLQRFLPR